jgi:hypothetical protein
LILVLLFFFGFLMSLILVLPTSCSGAGAGASAFSSSSRQFRPVANVRQEVPWGIRKEWSARRKPKGRGRSVAATVQGLRIRATQEGDFQRRRLVDVVKTLPRVARAYFKSPFRRALFGGIALLGGFYVAQTISLSFGALGVNDVIAAALCVLFTEFVTRFYHTRVQITFPIALLNNFKMGLTYGLFIDAFKLAS